MNIKSFLQCLSVGVLMLCFGSISAQSQTYYVQAGATGSQNGSDWNNAYTSLPTTLVRGATYYVGSGSYPSYAFKTPDSGTSWITVKKATATDHGTSAGWQTSYSNQAVFGGLNIGPDTGEDYFIFDGQTGGGPGSWTSGYGFKIAAGPNWTGPTIGIGNSGASYKPEGNIVVRHVDVQGNNPGGAGGNTYNSTQQGVTCYWGSYNCTFSYVYIHDQCGNPFQPLGTHDFVFEYMYIGPWWPENGDHTEWCYAHTDISDATPVTNVTVRFSILGNIPGAAVTGGLIMTVNNLYIYGNVFYNPLGNQWPYCTGGLIGNQARGFGTQNAYIYNNTFINTLGNNGSAPGYTANCVDKGIVFGFQVDGGLNINIFNNLYYLSVGLSYGNVANHDYNENVNLQNQLSSLGSITEPNGATNSVNPFVDYANYNFSPVSNTPPGMNLGPPYNVDMFGNTRTTWTRGAIEYVGGGVVNGNPSLQVTPGSLALGTILSGGSKTGSFTVKNVGGGTLSGTASVGSPFSIVSGGSYNLSSNQSQTVTMAFNPTSAGSYSQSVTLTGGGGASVGLTGSATNPPVNPSIQVMPGSIAFGTVLSGGSQTGGLTVKNVGGGTLSGTASVGSPFSIVSGGSYNLSSNQSQTVTMAFNPTSAGSYSQSVTLTGGGGASVGLTGSATNAPNSGGTVITNIIQGPTIAATSGILSGLLTASTVINGVLTSYFYQPLPSIGSTSGGSATYNVTITNAGNYEIQALVYTPNLSANSFLVNIDGQPQNPTMIWDIIPVTSGFEQRIVSWRGNGSAGNDQFAPKLFSLGAGSHQIIFEGLEPGTAMASFALLQIVTTIQSPSPPVAPNGLRIISSSP